MTENFSGVVGCLRISIRKITVDERSYESPTHEVDCFKNRVALEIEWNNKDPFFDRDLNNFRLRRKKFKGVL